MSSARMTTYAVRSLLAAAVLAVPAPALAQLPQRAPKRTMGASVHLATTATLTATVTESEPNDVVAQANLVTLGDTAGGTISVTGDVDSYALDLVAGTKLSLNVLASGAGSPLDPELTLVGTDGATILAFNDDYLDLDSHIEYLVTTTGRHFVRIRGFGGFGSPDSHYSLSFTAVPAGPGDPPTPYATGVGLEAIQIAAGPTGELYVADGQTRRLLRVAPLGTVSVVASYATGEAPTGVVVDGLGDLLVAVDQLTVGGRIERFSAGQRSTFASQLFSAVALTVGPDGDVWVIDPIAKLLRRYDPLGTPKSAVSLDDLKFIALHMGLAFSPAGDLYITNGLDAIYRIVDGVPQLVFRGTPTLGAPVFDRDGFLYVANPGLGRVILLDPDFHVVQDPFARSYQGGSSALAFLRDATGAETSRLVTGSVGLGTLASDLGVIAELNPAGVRAPGSRVGTDLLHVANAALPDGVVGADYAETLQLVAAPAPAVWSVSAGTLPPGLTLSPDGRLAGIPTRSGAYSFAVRAAAGAQLAFKAFTVTVTVPAVTVDAAAADLLGGAPLDLTRRRFLDLQGNRNGNFDIGDFRAFLRATGQLPAAAGKEQP